MSDHTRYARILDAVRAILDGVAFRPGARARVDLEDARVPVGADRSRLPSLP